jgi:hypothetical protein
MYSHYKRLRIEDFGKGLLLVIASTFFTTLGAIVMPLLQTGTMPEMAAVLQYSKSALVYSGITAVMYVWKNYFQNNKGQLFKKDN